MLHKKLLFAGIGLATGGALWNHNTKRTKSKPTGIGCKELSNHNNLKNGIWVSYGKEVFDISDFIKSHPGGDKILLAAGLPLEPFWDKITAHKDPNVYELLKPYKIGSMMCSCPDLIQTAKIRAQESFVDDIEISGKDFTIHSKQPLNAETLKNNLQEFITTNDKFFIRNHMPIPNCLEFTKNTYWIDICIENLHCVKFSANDLRHAFHSRKVGSTIQCAGNRRQDMNNFKTTRGLQWNVGAISNANWTGIPLRHIIEASYYRIPDEIQHVHFESHDGYTASIPVGKAMQEDTILAFEMNGHELPCEHGYPIRLVAPGIVGARNVKWIKKITLSKDEADSIWQKYDYKFIPSTSSLEPKQEVWEKADAIQGIPITSAITNVVRSENEITLSGYAYTGKGDDIVSVDCSIDDGKTWNKADITSEGSKYQWKLWKATMANVDKNIKIVKCRALTSDEKNNHQPTDVRSIWNFRGLLNNSVHSIDISNEK